MNEEKITKEELAVILDAANKVKLAELEYKNAQLVHQTTVQHIFMKYGLTFQDKIDDGTGVITRAPHESLEEKEDKKEE